MDTIGSIFPRSIVSVNAIDRYPISNIAIFSEYSACPVAFPFNYLTALLENVHIVYLLICHGTLYRHSFNKAIWAVFLISTRRPLLFSWLAMPCRRRTTINEPKWDGAGIIRQKPTPRFLGGIAYARVFSYHMHSIGIGDHYHTATSWKFAVLLMY